MQSPSKYYRTVEKSFIKLAPGRTYPRNILEPHIITTMVIKNY
jgi:hypothetical protein